MSKDKKLRVGIAGYGVVGQRRHKYLNQRDDVAVVAVCDKNAKHFTSLEEPIKRYDNYEGMLAESLDILFVCLTNDVNPSATIAGLKRGMHVFCEKPPGRTVQDIVDVREVERDCSGQILMYGFNHRYHDSIQQALEIIKSGEL